MSDRAHSGPILLIDDITDEHVHLCALFLAPKGEVPADLVVKGQSHTPERLSESRGLGLYRVRFTVPADQPARYTWDGKTYDLAMDFTGDLHIGYVSCNGQEHGDMDRPERERNAMWARLGQRHADHPMSLLLHGGDQLYADEVTDTHRLTFDWPESVPTDVSEEDLNHLFETLFDEFFARYAKLYMGEAFGWLAARVPSLSQWDDHDICDGWGSQPEDSTNSAVGQTLFAAAKKAALLFQHGCTEDDTPPRFADRTAGHLGWSVKSHGLTIMAPDLRAERTRHRVMGPKGWSATTAMAAEARGSRVLLMSSVPLLGPRLSILEALMNLSPGLQKYEDDLRDQWQSRAHRAEWQRMLRLVDGLANHPDTEVTAISGEIHLATRATMTKAGELSFHQLVASGITHPPPPKAWASALGSLAYFGEAPLPGHKIRIRPLPGQRHRYVAERNALILHREDDRWTAVWDLEHSGPTPPLAI
ncbi:MAG: alkaline phosphatase D family protein [Pseudomonadota bacterium]